MKFAGFAKRAFTLSGKGLVFLAVGLLALGWLLNTPPGLLGKADAVGYAVCHRIDARSFHLGVRQLPMCVRCSGMYLGALTGLIYQAVTARRKGGMPGWIGVIFIGLFVAAFGVDGLNSYLHLFPGSPGLYEPQNWMRLVTGSGMGLVVSTLIFPAFNQTVWKNWSTAPALPGLRAWLVQLLLVAFVDILVFTENPLILYPMAVLSALTVLFILTMVYTMVWLMILRAENRYQRFSELILPLTGGFGTALLQIVALDFARFLFTGTWDGFHLG